ncbi:hypothetical protein GCM10020367_62120 [Streptomyces sannanensis]|uniref:Terpene synthase n=1 Tax=Streptomyces sannanensis TaxID=285536 RepID=A0ABP6SM83_9ACTN
METHRIRALRNGLVRTPFPARCHPGHDHGRLHTLQWLDRFGMLSGERATAEYDAMRLELLMAYFYPDAGPEDLRLASDLMGWFFVFDDQFDGSLGQRPEAVARLVDSVMRVMHEDTVRPHESGDPLAESFRDLWQRVSKGMPPLWRNRFRDHWRDYLTAYHWEALNRTRQGTLPLAGFLQGRRDSIGVQPCLDLVERNGRYALPRELHQGAPLAEMRKITADVVIFVNDIVSVDKELAAGDVNNSVIILHKETGRTVDDAVRHVALLANSRLARFQELAAGIGGTLGDMGVPEDVRDQVDHYVDGMRMLMSGNLAWSLQTARYSEEGIAAVSQGRERPWAHLFRENARSS